jgi:DNA-binding NarL/FixJ family response regulator
MFAIRVLLVDDHPFVREGIRVWLQRRESFNVVGEAGNGQEALEMAIRLQPQVIIMDLHMPVMDGLEATRRLRRLLPDTRVLILSFHDGRDVLPKVMNAGARGYVSKSAPLLELGRAIETLHAGKSFFDPRFHKAFGKIAPRGKRERKLASRNPLSAREQEVLTLLADGMSNAQAAAVLSLSVRTVEKHRERIMDKLNLHKMVDLTKYAVANQLVDVD